MKPPRFPTGSDEAAGSSGGDEPAFLAVGRLRKPHGLRGDITMEVLTDFPERLKAGHTLFVGPQFQPMKLKSVKAHDPLLLVSFEGCDSQEEAGELRNRLVYVSASDRPPLEEGEYYHHQLLGLNVYTDEGSYLGTVSEIIETGSNDVLIILPESGPDILLPMLDEVILEVDLEDGRILVRLMPGLLGDS
jgi:16S rRNA processing protein RimM